MTAVQNHDQRHDRTLPGQPDRILIQAFQVATDGACFLRLPARSNVQAVVGWSQ